MDAADYEVARPSPLIRDLSPSLGPSEFGHFQKTHEFPRFLHPPVAHGWGRELAEQEVVGTSRSLRLLAP